MTKTIVLAVITICLLFGAFYLGLNIGLRNGSKGMLYHVNRALRKMGFTHRQRVDLFKAMHDTITDEDKEDASNE